MTTTRYEIIEWNNLSRQEGAHARAQTKMWAITAKQKSSTCAFTFLLVIFQQLVGVYTIGITCTTMAGSIRRLTLVRFTRPRTLTVRKRTYL